MTKEEILDFSIQEFAKEKGATSIYPKNFPVAYRDAAMNAMDEYAKQFGEKLIEWLNDNDFKFTNWKGNMQSDCVNGGARMHASEIIDLFIEQQQNK